MLARVRQIKNIKAVVWTEALTQFLFWKKAQGISEQTQKDYDQHVRSHVPIIIDWYIYGRSLIGAWSKR